MTGQGDVNVESFFEPPILNALYAPRYIDDWCKLLNADQWGEHPHTRRTEDADDKRAMTPVGARSA